MIEPLRSQID